MAENWEIDMNSIAFRNEVENAAISVVDIIVSDTSVGHRLGGVLPGPTLLVAGHSPISEAVFAQLMSIPTLGWMRGQIMLINLSALEVLGRDIGAIAQDDHSPDEVMFLPYDHDPLHKDQVEKEGCWAVLRLCTQLGMISGRGVPMPSVSS